jgi:hypothetical protein
MRIAACLADLNDQVEVRVWQAIQFLQREKQITQGEDHEIPTARE